MRWRVHECCCGCPIRRGTFIIGVINTVTVIYILVDLCLGGPIYKSTIPPIDDGYNIPQEKTFRNLLRLGYVGSLVVNGLVVLCSVLLIAGAVIIRNTEDQGNQVHRGREGPATSQVETAHAEIYKRSPHTKRLPSHNGISKKNRHYTVDKEFPLLLLPWAVFSSLLLVLVTVDGIYCSVYYTIYYSVIFGVLTTFCIILGLMVWMHFIFVVCSYYKTLLETRKNRSKEEKKEKTVV